jgi:hypothetical protein
MSTPLTFRTSPGSYAALCGVLSIPTALCWWAVLALDRRDLTMLSALFTAVVITAVVWLAYFRLRLDDSGIEYRDLFSRNFRLPYSEISSLKSRTISGRFSATQWTLHLHDGRKLRINLKPFPREAWQLLCQRVRGDA